MRRSDIDKSSYYFTKDCGVCHPGGGPTEYDRKGNRYDEFAQDPANHIQPGGDNYLDGDYYQSDWVKSGVLEADCLICHLKGYDWKSRARAVRAGLFSAAATIGAGWFKERPSGSLPNSPDAAVPFTVDYRRTEIVDPENLAAQITKAVPDTNCWACHVAPDRKKRGRSWNARTDVHKARGLNCVYCHPASEDHEMAKGNILVGSVRDDIDGTMKSCRACHLDGKDPRAPKAEHAFPALHLEKMTCESCHIPFKEEPATAAFDNATTGKTITYLTHMLNSNNPLDPYSNLDGAPRTRWYPAFLKHKGKIKPVDPMLSVWWGDWDRISHRVIPLFLWRIRDLTGATPQNKFSITNATLLNALKGSKEVNTLEEIETYLRLLSTAKDRLGMPIIYHTPVLVKGGMIYYLENDQLHKGPMPCHEGGFTCCEPFDLSHNIVSGKQALGATGCAECHSRPSLFFNRKILKDPFDEDGKPIYQEAWQLMGYSEKEILKLTQEVKP
jgi:hypothetical protein